MKHFLITLAVCTSSTLAFAADPTASEFARILQMPSLQQALAHVAGNADHLAIDLEQLGGMESAGVRVTVNLTGRSDRFGRALKDCEIAVEQILPKYTESGELNAVDFPFTDVQLKTMPVVENTCTKESR